MLSLVEIGSGFGEEDENVKSLQQQRRRTTDTFWSDKLT